MTASEPQAIRSLDDETLAVRAKDGCLDSYEELAVRLQVPLLQYLRHRARSQEDAEDLVQEAFLRAYRNLHRYEPAWRFSTWLFTIAHRLAINAFRRDSRKMEKTDGEIALAAAESNVPGPAEQVTRADERQRLWAIAAAELGEPKFTAVWLYYGKGMAVSEVAEVLERTPGAIKTMLLRARRQLLPALRQQWDEQRGAADGDGKTTGRHENQIEKRNTGVQ